MTATTEPRTARELIAQQAQEINNLRWQLSAARNAMRAGLSALRQLDKFQIHQEACSELQRAIIFSQP